MAVRYEATGQIVKQATLDGLRIRFGLDQRVWMQYYDWFLNVLQENLGWSFQRVKPASEIIPECFGITALISLLFLLSAFTVGILIGVVSAASSIPSWTISSLRLDSSVLFPPTTYGLYS